MDRMYCCVFLILLLQLGLSQTQFPPPENEGMPFGAPPNWEPNGASTPTSVEAGPPPDRIPNIRGGTAPRVPPSQRGGDFTNNQQNPSVVPRRPPPQRRPYYDIAFPAINYQISPQFDYANALAKSMLFYEAQRSGPLPYDHRIPWRGDSALDDGKDREIDLTGGYFDGGGYVKYGFPMACTTTVLSWGVIRYKRTYEAIGQLEHAYKTIKWATDYFVKCKVAKMAYFGQVSDQESDTKYTGRPEDMNYLRKSYLLNSDQPGSDLVAETAAAMAAASIVFYEKDSNYSTELIDHAKDLYNFSTTFKAKYHESIKPAEAPYGSYSGYSDEQAWAAAWIYRRTGQKFYLREAKKIYRAAKLGTMATMFSWDDKKVGVQMLMAEIVKGKDTYTKQVRAFCQWCLPSGKSTHTKKGLLFQQKWGPLRYAANAAFICSLAAELDINSDEYRLFASKQINYILGSSGRSFVVGFGENPPKKYYHKASYCPSGTNQCPAFSSNFDNAHVLYGAMIGGPDEQDIFSNNIEKREQSSVAIDYNAGYQSALAATLDLHVFGLNDRPRIDRPGKILTKTEIEALAHMRKSMVDEEDGKIVHNYGEALDNSLLFYEAQRSGKLDVDNRIPWRGDSALDDGNSINADLNGGYYDGGGYIKYTFPLAFTVTTLSWGLIEYNDAYNSSGNRLFTALETIKWGTDYLVKCDDALENELVIQVGQSSTDDLTWDRPEYMNATSERPVFTISETKPGADVAAEVAAAFSAVSIRFKDFIADGYRNTLIDKAKRLYKFAENHPGVYTEHLPPSDNTYTSSDYQDEMVWAALWIYKATEDTIYLNNAKNLYQSLLSNTPKTFSYDDKTAGVHLLMAEETGNSDEIAKFCNWVVKTAKKTEMGLFYYEAPATKHAGNVAFIMLLAAEKFSNHPDASSWKWFALDQINYILGSEGQSYQVGYGKKFPQQPYHKASSCPRRPLPCGFSFQTSSTPNQQLLLGAVVAGPDEDDNFIDIRTSRQHTAVSLDTNAGFQSAVVGLIHLQNNGLLDRNGASVASFYLNKLSFPVSIVVTILWSATFQKFINFLS